MRAFVAALVSCLVFFSLGELGARIWIDQYGNALDVSRKVLEADAMLGWKQRANLDATFLHTSMQTNETGWRTYPLSSLTSKRNLVLVLGPSSTFGWGIEEHDTYSAQLEQLLQDSTPTTVLNAGEIGYSSEQGVKLFSQSPATTLKPNVVVIAYGVNDLDRSRFYFQSDKTDAEELRQPESSSATRKINILYSSTLVSVLIDASSNIRSWYASPPIQVSDPVPTVRVPIQDFIANIENLIHAARIRNASPVLLTTTTNLPRATKSPLARQKFAEGAAAWQKGDILVAKQLFQDAVAIEPTLCEAYYYLSATAVHDGDIAQAKAYFQKARDTEPYRISDDVTVYNAALTRIAEKEHVPLLNLENVFKGHDAQDLFVDPIHFSKKGNALVAQGLENILVDERLLR